MKLNGMLGFTRAGLLMGFFAAGLMVMPVKGNEMPDGANNANAGRVVEKRDPFWPIGYAPAGQSVRSVMSESTGGVSVSSWDEAMKHVVINGVSSRKDTEYFAVINGDVKRVGDTVSVRLGNMIYTWAVDGIETKGSVKLRRVSVRQA